MKENGRFLQEKPVPEIHFKTRSVHYDKRTYILGSDFVTLTVLEGRYVKTGVNAGLIVGERRCAFMSSGSHKGAELVLRKNK
jgi:hypothetical protein